MKIVNNDSVVIFNYKVRSTGEKVLNDNSRLVKCNMDDKSLMPGIFDGLLGMQVGQKKTFRVEKERGYGEVKQDLIRKLPKKILAGNDVPKGSVIKLKEDGGNILKPIVRDIDKESVLLDFNHPLAGKDLVFEVEIKNIQEKDNE